jgi:hypothetical protein
MSRLRTATQVGFLLVPVLWIATRYSSTYYFYDEWSLLAKVSSPLTLRSAMVNLNGHLWLFPGLLYRAQVSWLGVNNHALVWSAFCFSLLLLAVAVRWLLIELAVPSWASTAAAVVIAFFGVAAQNITFEVQVASNTSYALGLLSAAVALRWRTYRGAAVCSLLLLVATGFDSAGALLSLAFVGPLTAVTWRDWRKSSLLLVPVVANALWYEVASRGPSFTAPLGISTRFGIRLFLVSAGGLAGGGRDTGVVLLVVLVLASLLVWRRGQFTPVLVGSVAGALLTAIGTTVILAMTRAGTAGPHLNDYNRYLEQIAVFVLVAGLPVLWKALPNRVEPILVVALMGVFALNLPAYFSYRTVIEGWEQEVRVRVNVAVAQLVHACPPGTELLPETTPVGDLGPQTNVALLQALVTRGVLSAHPVRPPTAPVVACTRVKA